MDQPVKRIKIDNQEIDAIKGVRANDIIELLFTESASLVHVFKPSFTHQIFENEMIGWLQNPSNVQVKIVVSCVDMSQYVYIGGCSTDEREKIVSHLQPVLPPDTQVRDFDGSESHLDQGAEDVLKLGEYFAPPGTFWCEFNDEKTGNIFQIWRAKHSDSRAQELLHVAEKMSMWFIETADGVDFSDDRWEVLFLFQTVAKKVHSIDDKTCGHRFAGYFTLFTFRNPFAGSKTRVCQALVLPHFQGRGLGEHMLRTVYEMAREREDVVEVTVEDPAEGFARLRDKTDFLWFQEKLVQRESESVPSSGQSTKGRQSGGHGVAAALSLSLPFDGDAKACAKELKIIKSQAAFVLDAMRYIHLHRSHCSHQASPNPDPDPTGAPHSHAGAMDPPPVLPLEDTESFRRFRLDVKRRLLAESPEAQALAKEAKQQLLEELFQIELQRIAAVTKRLLQ